MTEEQVDKESPEAATEPQMSKALTIPANRLAGSDCCLNCGAELCGPFCYYCGQPDKNFMRFFPILLRELMEDFLDLDSRFMRTLKPLLFQPGKLTRNYLDGQRFRYTPPLRLYIFSSMAFFILAAMLAGSSIKITSYDDESGGDFDGIHIGTNDEVDLEEMREKLDSIDPGLADKVAEAVEEAKEQELAEKAADPDTTTITRGLEINDDDSINLNGEPWDRETNPFIIPFMPDFVNDWVNDEIEESPQKGKEIEANPNLIINKVFDVLPITMFVLLPLSALLLKFWYLFAGRYFIEHLIMALHNHSFLFVVFLLTMLLNSLAGWQEPGEEGPVTTTVFWINTGLLIWIPIYFLISLKRVYQQGWKLTFSKYLVVGLSYMILLTMTASVAAIVSFVLL
jgi:hypothetical protein